jgi:hypothetical protein
MTPEQHIAAMEARGANVKVTEKWNGTVRVVVTWEFGGVKDRMAAEGSKRDAIGYMHQVYMQIADMEETVKVPA